MEKNKKMRYKNNIIILVLSLIFISISWWSPEKPMAVGKSKKIIFPTPVVEKINKNYFVGDELQFKITSKDTVKNVQYKVMAVNETTKRTYNLTKDFTELNYNPKYVYKVNFKFLEKGNYSFYISCKLAGYSSKTSKMIKLNNISVSEKKSEERNDLSEVISILPIREKIFKGTNYELPKKVFVEVKDGSRKEMDVKWDIKSVSTSIPGIYNITGTVKGTNKKASLALEVVENQIVSIDNLTVTVNEGDDYRLLNKVKAKLADNTFQDVDVKWDSNVDTNKPGTYIIEGNVADYKEKVKLTLIVNPVEFRYIGAESKNLKEVVLKFNKKLEYTTVKETNIRLFKNTAQIAATVELLPDQKTVVINPGNNSVLENRGKYTLVLENIRDINGAEIKKTVTEFVSLDNESPKVKSVVFTGPNSLDIEFTEPIKDAGRKNVELRNDTSILGTGSNFSGFGTNKINASFNFTLTENQKYFITISGFKDYADQDSEINVTDLIYKKDISPINVSTEFCNESFVVLKFNKPVLGLTKEHFYSTVPSWTAIQIYSDPAMTKTITNTTLVDRVYVKFFDKITATGHPLTGTAQSITILDKAGLNEIKDAFGNRFSGKQVILNIKEDKEPPRVVDIKQIDDSTLSLEFSEEVKFSYGNVEIMGIDGKVIGGIVVIPTGDEKKFNINMGRNYTGNSVIVNLKNVEDKALIPNKMPSFSKVIEMSDKTPPQAVRVVKKFITGLEDALYITFNEPIRNVQGSYYLQNPANNSMVKLTDSTTQLGDKTVVVPLTREQKSYVEAGYNLFISNVEDVNKNILVGQIIINSKFVNFDSQDNKPQILSIEATDKKTVQITYNQYLSRVDREAFMVNGALPSQVTTETNKDGNTVVILKSADGYEFNSDLSGNALLVISIDNVRKIENSFGQTAVSGAYTVSTPLRIQDKIPPEIKRIAGKPQIKFQTNNLGAVDTIILEYEENIDMNKLSALTYGVDGRTVLRTYSSSIDRRGTPSNGRFVIVELKTDGNEEYSKLNLQIKQLLDIYDMNNNKKTPDGEVYSLQDRIPPMAINRITTQIEKGQNTTLKFTKPLNEISKTIIENSVLSASRGKGKLVFSWISGSELLITNVSSFEATDFELDKPVKVVLIDLDGNITSDVIIIGR